jgi:hypothetical protein
MSTGKPSAQAKGDILEHVQVRKDGVDWNTIARFAF